jgi:hypothetical protein
MIFKDQFETYLLNESQSLHRQRLQRQMTSPTDDFTDSYFTDRLLHRQITSPTVTSPTNLKVLKVFYIRKLFS